MNVKRERRAALVRAAAVFSKAGKHFSPEPLKLQHRSPGDLGEKADSEQEALGGAEILHFQQALSDAHPAGPPTSL